MASTTEGNAKWNNKILHYQILEVATGALTYWNASLLNFTVESLHPYYEYQVSVAAATVGLIT